MKVFRIWVQQSTRAGSLWNADSFDVKASSAVMALKRAFSTFRKSNKSYLRSRPIEVVKLEQLSSELI